MTTTCSFCVAGHTENCDTVLAEAMGAAAHAPEHGGFATRIRVSGRRVIPVPDSMSDIEAALLEPAAVAFHAVRRAEIPFGAIVVVQGAGPIGLLTAQCARNAGASTVIISEPSPKRQEAAQGLGFSTVIPPNELAQVLSDATTGRGADVVFECSGVAALLQSTAELVRRGGQLSLVGFPADLSEVSYSDWQIREITVVGSLAYAHEDFVGAITAITQKRLDVLPLHTGTIGLSELTPMFDELDSGTTEHTKVLVDPRR